MHTQKHGKPEEHPNANRHKRDIFCCSVFQKQAQSTDYRRKRRGD